ncbi:MAG TPA: NAD(P)/FAD-dependent oxidoreductase [Candidatus Binatia bacterium]|jgi:4-hydroxyacetophenone monooxygenase|nr:NAD(P)/FAD-dependent oxidoreductase [Candidatus Binatia bacterium]
MLPAADAPITEDDEFLARVLEHASIPTLMMSLVHLTGDTSLLRGTIRPGATIMGDVDGGMSAEDKAAVRAMALDALRAYRDRGCTLPPPPSDDTVREMLSFMVGTEVPAAYVPMMLEEMALDGRDARDVAWDDVPHAAREAFRVVVIGAGMSGLLAAIRLEEAGVPYVVIEKNTGVGGTWFENAYPGCRVDVANHFYSYSFAPNHDWPEHFSQRDELQAYFDRCASDYDTRAKIRFGTEVVAARFDEGTSRWTVTLRTADGDEETLEANAIISAVGQLNRPKLPDIPGRDTFAGAAFHSARWPEGIDLTGKRVAVIGTGASAFQLVPEVAKVASHVEVFQRSAPWMVPNPRYHARVSDRKRWLLTHVPYYARWYRFLLFWPGSDGLMPALVVDPEWPHQERSVNAMNEMMREIFTHYMAEQIGDDAELLDKVTPRYPPFIKRMLQDNGSWLGALKRPNVDLVTDRIAAITPDSVRCADGSEHPVDVIVYATGFHANRFLWPMEIVGRGVSLREQWGDDPKAYLGITVPGFPNLFCLYGPGTNLAHAGSIIFHSECQVRYVMGCLAALMRGGHAAMECRQDVHDAYYERFEARHATLVWSHPGETSWYKNAAGRIRVTSPWLLVEYWGWTKTPDLDDFALR